jgi:hypothetical protein
MSLPDADPSSIPAVDASPASPMRELLAPTSDPEGDELSRTIWEDFCGDLLPRLDGLEAQNRTQESLLRELHSLRGSSAQFGFFLLEVLLFSWEKKEPDPVAVTPKYLPVSRTVARQSIGEVERLFPHLKSPAR